MYSPNSDRYNSMKYNRCGLSGIKLPAVSLGLWHNFGSVDSFANARIMVQRAFDLGITHFDLANNYGPAPGSAEETFGKILKKDFSKHRDELIISTKAGYLMSAGTVWRMGFAKIPDREFRSKLNKNGSGICRYFLSPPAGSGNTA